VLYLAIQTTFAILGEIRITKAGDAGKIFTGVGKFGRTHRVRWSDYDGVADQEEPSYSSGRFSRTTHFIGLTGERAHYRFGSDLSEQQQASIIAFLRAHVFGENRGN
jgi:hypothetical protein